MSLQKVRDEIECMRRIVEILKEMETERSRKFENCLPDSMSAVGVGKTPLLRHQRPHHDHIVPTPRLLIFGGEQAKNTSSRLHQNHLLPGLGGLSALRERDSVKKVLFSTPGAT
jgi:hypothetical protein